ERTNHQNYRLGSFAPDGKTLALINGNNVVLWDIARRKERASLAGHQGGVTQVLFSPDGRRLASASTDSTIKLWDAAAAKELATIKGHKGSVASIAFSPDSSRLASSSSLFIPNQGVTKHELKLWDVPRGTAPPKERLTFALGERNADALAFTADG